MDTREELEARIRPAEQARQHAPMHRTADGQSLGDTLHDAYYRDLGPA